jgi:serine/threonine-protein kinase
VVWRALAKAPEGRYPSAGDLGRAALAAARGEAITEAERSVARGPAAPAETDTRGLEPAVTGPAPTRVIAAAPPPPKKVHRARPRRWVVALAALTAAAAGVGGIALATSAGGGDDGGPLSRAEVLEAVDGFARAYSHESVPAMRAVLAPNVRRVVPGDRQVGRAAVVAEYRRQFAASDVVSYRLSGLEVTEGEAGRASGRYTVQRRGRPPIVGDTVFGVVRQGGAPRIALIAAEPAS